MARGSVGNLPLELTSFVGRRSELAEVRQLLTVSRLVTLTGFGGVGKTRMALRAAANLHRTFPDGVWFVDLTTVRVTELATREVADTQLLAHVVAATLGVREQSAAPQLDALAGQLAGRRLLLVLDNCEHLVSACAVLVDTLLHRCPGLRVLATSRESLRISAEAIFPMPALPVPDPDRASPLADLTECDSVALFVARADAIVSGFRLTEGNRQAVAEICQRLDGLPLAIELVATRLRVLSPEQILQRLTDRFALLTGGHRNVPERQQTLLACVEWSYELCSKPEQVLWARLSVFVGGFELDALEGICSGGDVADGELVDLIASLVDRSVLGREDHDGAPRYRLLETLRAFGQEKLRSSGETATLRRRHRDWYEQLVAQIRTEWISDRQASLLARLDRDYANLRAAVGFSLTEPGEADGALRIEVSLPIVYRWARGLFGEGRDWLERALLQTDAQTPLRARAVVLASELATAQGDFETGRRLLAQGRELAERLHDPTALAHALAMVGYTSLGQGDLQASLKAFGEAVDVRPNPPAAELDLRLELLRGFLFAAGMAGDTERVLECQREILEITEPRGEGFERSKMMFMLGFVAFRHGDLAQAEHLVTDSVRLRLTHGLDDRSDSALCLEILAWTAAGQRQSERAATLLGAADVVWTALGPSVQSAPLMVSNHAECERQARAALGDTAFEQGFRHGRSLEYVDALAYAVHERRQPSSARPAAAGPVPLTPRGRQVAESIAQGLSNREIAKAMGISPRTVDSHVESIMARLGISTRTQIAAWVVGGPADDRDS
jgi:predicted ATPase/DNA-binding CsgD family transcriptional regulator